MEKTRNSRFEPMFVKVAGQAEALTILDLRVQFGDGDTTDAIASSRVIQGLVNRSGKDKLYLYNDCTDSTHDIGGREWNAQLEWQRQTEELRDLPTVTLERELGLNGGLHALLKRYSDKLRGFVVWDPNPHNKVNMATFGAAVTVASQLEGLAVSPDLLEQIQGWGFRFPVLEDLRSYRFQSDHEALEWSIDRYWESSNRELRAVFSLGMDGWAPVTEWADNWLSNDTFHEGPIDYAVAVNGFSFNINMMDGNDDYALLKLLRKYPEGKSAILGWVPTHPFVYGFSEMPTCLNLTSYFVAGVNGFSNMSVFASFPDSNVGFPEGKALAAQAGDVFVNFFASDGDALHCVYRGMFSAFTTRKDENFGRIPMTWTISPILANLAPPVYNFFARQVPPTSDLAAAWANKVHTVHDTALAEVTRNIKQHANLANLGINWTVHSAEETQLADKNEWDGIIVGYSNSRVEAKLSKLNPKTAVWGTWSFGEHVIDEAVEGIRQCAEERQGNEPLFMSILLGAAFDKSGDFYSQARMIADRLFDGPDGARYKFVNARDMAATYKGYVEGLQK
ncbi:hypothetical protein D7Z26_16310 [Cohnella endophytica]|uniref:Uncharacterized protein n=1 Tax=Cohnella endophytica TaxID=2419778 RepID=A0A494XNK0_9BACL|nr:GxGYxYP domain-containing protein [Cohnella endophytica]RKP51362.1 hypothetical protein D7Z26_16310 [Cohnella endophytica]